MFISFCQHDCGPFNASWPGGWGPLTNTTIILNKTHWKKKRSSLQANASIVLPQYNLPLAYVMFSFSFFFFFLNFTKCVRFKPHENYFLSSKLFPITKIRLLWLKSDIIDKLPNDKSAAVKSYLLILYNTGTASLYWAHSFNC